jgi:hypothetical protein
LLEELVLEISHLPMAAVAAAVLELQEETALLQQVARRRWQAQQAGGPVVPAGVCEAYRGVFSFAAAGWRYRQRLEELWQQRQALAAGLRWRADCSPWPAGEQQPL